MIFRRAQQGTITITKEVLTIFDRYRQHNFKDHEAGGILLGRFIKDSLDIVVDVATEPSQGDITSRFSFFRSQKRTQTLVDQVWLQSNGTQNYLGEWHTHPERYPSPSRIDLKNWHRIVIKAQYEQDSLLFIIVGQEMICLWELSKISKELIQLESL
jgi:hypothetical protein